MGADGVKVIGGRRRGGSTSTFTRRGIGYNRLMRRRRHDQEELLNGELARLLTLHGAPSSPERRAGARRIDVTANIDGLRVVLEAETGFDKKQQAIRDADARLRQGLTAVVFAVCYPEGATTQSLEDSTLTWTVRVKAGESAGAWSTGGVSHLAHAVRQAPNSLSGADIAAQILSDTLDSVVQGLDTPTRMALARDLDLPKNRQAAGQNGYYTAAKRGMLVIATAMLFHHRVQNHLPESSPPGYDGPWPPASPADCAEREGATIQAHSEAWRAILAVDYRPVFETARAALSALPSHPDSSRAVRILAQVTANISEMVAGLRHDLLGRIFHRVLDTARYDGSFYTSTAAATLLASLALRRADADWADPEAVGRLRIADPACGTGTLLMAAAERIRDLRHEAGAVDSADDEILALLLVEDVLWGYDVNLTATHMAASTIGMLSPTTQFSRMNIHRTLLGVYGGTPYLGSLEFLCGQPRLASWPATAQQVEHDHDADPPPPMDLVIMNPPFTRDSLRHDQFSRAEEKAIKDREKGLLAGQLYQRAARLSGSANSFLVLGERMARSDKAIFAVVLPTVMATNPAALETRRYLSQNFHVDTIVSSHDPGRIYFSENTSISEALLICRRWNGEGSKPPTRIVNLAENPDTPVKSLDVAARIDERRSGRFTVQTVPPERIERGDWNSVNFLAPSLVDAFNRIADSTRTGAGGLFPALPLEKMADVGPAGQAIRGAYVRSDMPTSSGWRALWHHKTEVTQTMLAQTDSYIEPKSGRGQVADNYWSQRGRLFLPARLRLNTTRAASVFLEEPALGSIWVPCRPKETDPLNEQALCLYLNSSVGVLSMLGGRGHNVLSRPTFSMDALRSLPVPDFAALGDQARDFMASNFQWLQGETLLPLPRMNDDPVRKRIDDAVTEALGLDPEWASSIRRSLSEEPSIANRRFGE